MALEVRFFAVDGVQLSIEDGDKPMLLIERW
jgi:hypothetical protein